jgi:hypothetical protein
MKTSRISWRAGPSRFRVARRRGDQRLHLAAGSEIGPVEQRGATGLVQGFVG